MVITDDNSPDVVLTLLRNADLAVRSAGHHYTSHCAAPGAGPFCLCHRPVGHEKTCILPWHTGQPECCLFSDVGIHVGAGDPATELESGGSGPGEGWPCDLAGHT